MGGASWSGRGLGIELRNLDAARAHGLWIRNPDADELRADTRCLQPWADRHAAHTHTHTHTIRWNPPGYAANQPNKLAWPVGYRWQGRRGLPRPS